MVYLQGLRLLLLIWKILRLALSAIKPNLKLARLIQFIYWSMSSVVSNKMCLNITAYFLKRKYEKRDEKPE